jgi:hypothetical protein
MCSKVRQQRHRKDADQGGRHRFRDLRRQVDDRHRQRHQAEHGPQLRAGHPAAALLEVLELGDEDHDRQAVHEAQHDRVRHHADEFAEPREREQDLQHAHQDDGGEQVLHAMLDHQRDHDHGQRAGGAGNHARPAAEG